MHRVGELVLWVAAQSWRETIRIAELPSDLRAGIPELAEKETIEVRFLAQRVQHVANQLRPKTVGRRRRASVHTRALSRAIEQEALAKRSGRKTEMPSAATIRGTLHPPEELSEGAYWLLDAPSAPFLESKGDASALRERKAEVRERIWSTLVEQAGGDPRTHPVSWDEVVFPEKLEKKRATPHGTRYLEREFFFPSGLDAELITGRILLPDEGGRNRPAVLYMHFDGGLYGVGTGELAEHWDLDGAGTIADRLIDDGRVVLATDARGFGRRRANNAYGGDRESGYHAREDREDERRDFFALAASARSRYAKRSYEDYLAFRLLSAHPDVDPSKIGAIGVSMGCVRSWTLAALAGKQLRGAVASGTWPRYQDLLETNKHGCHRDAHNFRDALTRVGLDTESFVLAAAETNTLAIMGDQDPCSPGWHKVFEYGAHAAHALGEGRFETMILKNHGHGWTRESIARALAFFREM